MFRLYAIEPMFLLASKAPLYICRRKGIKDFSSECEKYYEKSRTTTSHSVTSRIWWCYIRDVCHIRCPVIDIRWIKGCREFTTKHVSNWYLWIVNLMRFQIQKQFGTNLVWSCCVGGAVTSALSLFTFMRWIKEAANLPPSPPTIGRLSPWHDFHLLLSSLAPLSTSFISFQNA